MPGTSWGFLEGGFPLLLRGLAGWGGGVRPESQGGEGSAAAPPHLCATFASVLTPHGGPASWLSPGPHKGLGFRPTAQPCPAPQAWAPSPGLLLPGEAPSVPFPFPASGVSDPLPHLAAHSPGRPGSQLLIVQMGETEARVPREPRQAMGVPL